MMRDIAADSVQNLNRTYYVEDSKFIELISVFQSHLQKKRTGIDSLSKRLQTGLQQFMVVRDTVTQLQSELEAKIPILSNMSEDLSHLMFVLADKRTELKQNKENVQQEEQFAEEMEAQARELRRQAESELATALPALEDADKYICFS